MTSSPVPLSQITRAFARVGILSFGGPAAQIALMHRTLVEDRRWLSEDQFLRALSFCMLLPGPEAMQLATYAGWRLRGIPGGVIAGGLFVLPGAIIIALLALAYSAYGTRPDATAALMGIQAAVIAIVIQALIRLTGKALRGTVDYALAGGAFVAIFAFGLPFPLIIALAAAIGALRAGTAAGTPAFQSAQPTPLGTLTLWAGLWLAPLGLLWLTGQTLLFELAAFFAWLAVVTFGGAYAVLAYMAQEVVAVRGWVETQAMVDALGLAETTPGPLILVTQFVGHLVGEAAGGPWLGLAAGVLTLWMTFVPCFLWIFAGAPYVEMLTARPRLKAALAAVTAAVVGVILNLSLWFAIHVLFARTTPYETGALVITLPDPGSLNLAALALVVLAGWLLGILRLSVPLTIALAAGAGWTLHLI
jgi:chromate transporter